MLIYLKSRNPTVTICVVLSGIAAICDGGSDALTKNVNDDAPEISAEVMTVPVVANVSDVAPTKSAPALLPLKSPDAVNGSADVA